MFKLLAATAALALAPNSTPYSSSVPPLRYQQGAASILVTVHPSMLPSMCNLKVPKGYELKACMYRKDGVPVIFMPNPCAVAEEYAQILCHEQGHVNGWPGTHGD